MKYFFLSLTAMASGCAVCLRRLEALVLSLIVIKSMFWVYMLKCRDQSYYVGHTDNLEARLFQHQNKLIPGCYTCRKLPVKLVYYQDFLTREEALSAEQQIKGWSRRKKEALIQHDWFALAKHAKRATSC